MSMGDRMTADAYEHNVVCKLCGEMYHQKVEDQASGYRIMSIDECPYCGAENGRSMHSDYTNYKIGRGETL